MNELVSGKDAIIAMFAVAFLIGLLIPVAIKLYSFLGGFTNWLVLFAIVTIGYSYYTDYEKADNLQTKREALISTTAADISTESEVLTLEEFIKWSDVLSKNWVLQGEESMKGSSCIAQVNRNNNGVIKTIEISDCNNVPKNIESAFKNSIKRAIERSVPIPLIKNEKDQSFNTTFKISN